MINSAPSQQELFQALENVGLLDLVEIVRKGLEKNPHSSDKSTMWKEQCIINFPMLYMASIVLRQYGIERGCCTFLFASRDCCHWYRIFKALFPALSVHYLTCSRNMFDAATQFTNDHYNKYISDLLHPHGDVNKTVYIDVHGTGLRMFNYFEKNWKSVPYCFLLTAFEYKVSEMPRGTKYWANQGKLKVLKWNVHGAPIESLNYDIVGTVQQYGNEGVIREKLEYSLNMVRPYHACIDVLVKMSIPLSEEQNTRNTENIVEIIKMIGKQAQVCSRDRPIVSHYVRHVVQHPLPPPNENGKKIRRASFKRRRHFQNRSTYAIKKRRFYS